MKIKNKRIKIDQKDELLSLSQAAKVVNYSSGYLKNLALSGDLQAQKLGRNWYTKKEWLKDYFDNGKKTRKSKEEFQEIYQKLFNEEAPEPVLEIEQKRNEISQMPIRLASAFAIFLIIILTSAKITRDDFINPGQVKVLGEETENLIPNQTSSTDQSQTQSNFINLNYPQSQIAQNFLGSFYLIETTDGIRYANGDISFFPDYGLKLRRKVVEGKNITRHTITAYNLKDESITNRTINDDETFHFKSLDIEDDIDLEGDLNIEGDIYQNGTLFVGGGGGGNLSAGDNISLLTNDAGYITDGNTNWNNSYGFITSYTETDPIFTLSDAFAITATNISNWNTAYGWGDHSLAGYITDGNTNWDNSYGFITDGNTGWDNSYGFITASSADALTNKTGNISM